MTNLTSVDKVIASTDQFTILRRAAGTYRAVGTNADNALSDGTLTNSATPVQMEWASGQAMTTTNVQSFAVGAGSYNDMKSDNAWYAQGRNAQGELARGSVEANGALGRYPEAAMWDSSNPMTKTNALEVWSKDGYSQFQRADGSWWAVGGNADGTLVDGTTTDCTYPVSMKWDGGAQIGLG
jgi:alpha-tubulin suppressor-like RCC1 family protein